ncbi:M15 family metallopeptidase [Allobaculum sp. JKK-2023]|uniref:M15 family metallopeptidase n=1 Tax=Allobaculum sp. JKK-2023 TaxID=3108943 RepID=UPI002B05C162|nr:M15 family metallopeptidase [Allobaculum sp. JKK-2023]
MEKSKYRIVLAFSLLTNLSGGAMMAGCSGSSANLASLSSETLLDNSSVIITDDPYDESGKSEKRTMDLRQVDESGQRRESDSEIEELPSVVHESLDSETLPVNETTSSSSASETTSSPVSENKEGRTYVNGVLIVNKKHPVPADYAPGVDPEAQAALNNLLDAMQSQSLNVSRDTSNYRSYQTQTALYNGYVNAPGQQQADTFSARPGFSEHQTGLAFDLKDTAGQLLTSPTEAQWLLDHAAEYGFIVRYQAGKESITGYQAEPWHLRYLGELAKDVAASGLTLEEYLGVEGGDYQ